MSVPDDVARPARLSPGDLLRLALLGIRTRKTRAALSALGISIGIATMVIVTGVPASGQQALMNNLIALGTNMPQAVPAQLPGGSVSSSRNSRCPWCAGSAR